jgi:hypothetical protein
MKKLGLIILLSAGSALSRTKSVDFIKGKSFDTLSMYPGYSENGMSYYDTLLVSLPDKDTLRVFPFTADAINTFCDGVRTVIGFVYKSKKGLTGKLSKGDTLWTEAKVFPDSFSRLDSVPTPGYRMLGEENEGFMPKYVGNFTAYSKNIQTICTLPTYTMASGFNQIIYYYSNNVYAKFQIYSAIDTTVVLFGVNTKRIKKVEVRYLLTTTRRDLSDPTNGVIFLKRAQFNIAHRRWFSVRDLLGRVK